MSEGKSVYIVLDRDSAGQIFADLAKGQPVNSDLLQELLEALTQALATPIKRGDRDDTGAPN